MGQNICPCADMLLVVCRSGKRLRKASHKDWLRSQILEIFFVSDEVLFVFCQNGLLYSLDHRSGAVSASVFAKVRICSHGS